MSESLPDKDDPTLEERDAQARANNAIEGLRMSPEHEALFAEFDALGLDSTERLRRIEAVVKRSVVVAAE